MRAKILAAITLLAVGSTAHAGSHSGSGYLAADLLSPCQEADNDARWGEAAETECEQYLIGYVDALAETGGLGAEGGICLPEQNVADEVRWAFMRWVHQSYTARTKVPASTAVLDTLKTAFPCS